MSDFLFLLALGSRKDEEQNLLDLLQFPVSPLESTKAQTFLSTLDNQQFFLLFASIVFPIPLKLLDPIHCIAIITTTINVNYYNNYYYYYDAIYFFVNLVQILSPSYLLKTKL